MPNIRSKRRYSRSMMCCTIGAHNVYNRDHHFGTASWHFNQFNSAIRMNDSQNAACLIESIKGGLMRFYNLGQAISNGVAPSKRASAHINFLVASVDTCFPQALPTT